VLAWHTGLVISHMQVGLRSAQIFRQNAHAFWPVCLLASRFCLLVDSSHSIIFALLHESSIFITCRVSRIFPQTHTRVLVFLALVALVLANDAVPADGSMAQANDAVSVPVDATVQADEELQADASTVQANDAVTADGSTGSPPPLPEEGEGAASFYTPTLSEGSKEVLAMLKTVRLY
jgi:hypothetical protein